jgi:F0F1-type ATP synthase assembly protein I
MAYKDKLQDKFYKDLGIEKEPYKEDRKFGETAKEFHVWEAWILLGMWIFIGLLIGLFAFYIKGAVYGLLIITIIGFTAGIVFFIVIKIPYVNVLEIKLSKDKTIDQYSFVSIPLHQWGKWLSGMKGSAYPLINKADGTPLYVCKDMDLEKKILIFEHDPALSYGRYLVDKRVTIEAIEENMILKDKMITDDWKIDDEVLRRSALFLNKFFKRKVTEPESLQFSRDYGQNRLLDKKGLTALSLMGEDVGDMDKDQRELYEGYDKSREKEYITKLSRWNELKEKVKAKKKYEEAD